jgi:DNA sulfur modification protein DndD
MILDELVIENLGVFNGRQSIKLAPPEPGKPVVVIGGMNGRGKTTLLDAVQLALYGVRARPSNRGSLGYEEYLSRVRFRHTDSKDVSAVEIAFSIRESTGPVQYRVRRVWKPSSRGLKESIIAFRNGAIDRALTATWAEHIEEILPLEISSLFFFDGEKIEALADPAQASEVISAAVSGLLGFGVVERLQRDLMVLEKRKLDTITSEENSLDLTTFRKTMEETDKVFLEMHQRRAGEQNRLDRIESELIQIEKDAQREGGDLFERRAEIESLRSEARNQKINIEVRMRELAHGPLPLLICHSLVESLSLSTSNAISIDHSVLQDILNVRDEELLSNLQEELSPEALDAIKSLLEADRMRRADQGHDKGYKPPMSSILVARSALNQAVTDALDLNGMNKEETNIEELIIEFESQLVSVPSEDAIAEVLERRNDIKSRRDEIRGRLAVLDEELAALDRARITAKADHDSARRDNALAQLKGQDAERIIIHAGKVRDTLDRFKEEVRQRSILKIQSAVLHCYEQLLGKKNLIAALELDPITCVPTLTTSTGAQVNIERLSAGERQLFAVAMLWGFASVSGRSLPTIIDTPLGRLDSVHRSLLVERYFPFASEQVILLSTDEEIDESLFSRLESSVGRNYRLEYNEESQSSEIVEGYLFERGEHAA